MGKFIFMIIFGAVFTIVGFMFIISLVEILKPTSSCLFNDDYRKSTYITSCFLGVIFLTMLGVLYFYI